MPATFDLESLLSPLPGAAGPCGENLEYDAQFLQLLDAGKGKPEQVYGDKVYAAVPPNWPEVQELALALAQRTRDLRLAVWLTRTGARLHGLEGAAHGLRLVHGLLERYWDDVHPRIDTTEGADATARVNALAPLADLEAGLADFRATPLTRARGSLTVRDLELALGRAKPFGNEPVPTDEGVITGVGAAMREFDDLGTWMRDSVDLVTQIALRVEQRLGVMSGLDLVPLHRLLRPLQDAAKRVVEAAATAGASVAPRDAASPVANGAARPATLAASPSEANGVIASRDDVVQARERACFWIEHNEPGHPAPLLIRRAQRLMSKSFVEILRDIAPESLGQLEKVAGERFE